jgi:hypothetical protein
VEETYAAANIGAFPWQPSKWEKIFESLPSEESTYRLQPIINHRSSAATGHGNLPIEFFERHKHGKSLPLRLTGVPR